MEQKSTANKSTKPRSFTGFAVVFMALTLVIAIVLNLLASRLNIV